MSSLTVEMGLRRRRDNSPQMPDALASRDDMTLAQKQRLAVLAKMGVGPIAPPAPQRYAPQPRFFPDQVAGEPASAADRRAVLLEREKKIKELELRQKGQDDEMDGLFEKQPKEKKTMKIGGLKSLGAVQPRVEDIPQFLVSPAQLLEAKRPDTLGQTKAFVAGNAETDDDDDDHGADPEAVVLALIQKMKNKVKKRKSKEETPQQKPGNKKKKKKNKGDDAEDWDGQGEDEALDDDEEPGETLAQHQERKIAHDGGISKQTMLVESVKGKVSTANKNFTDADLERRFPVHGGVDNVGRDASLMTEAEVLKMIRKEKEQKGASNTGSASRRVKRELAEWAAAKEQQRARVKSPHRFERMVVARK